MSVRARSTWRALSLAVLAAAGCRSEQARSSPLERSLEAALGARFGVRVTTRCFGLFPACVAQLPDVGAVPIVLDRVDGAWEWRLDGLVISTEQLEAYLRDEVAELGAPQAVRCAPRLRWLAQGERIECALARGGKAFVVVRADGSASFEIVLEPAAASARSEPVTPARDAELARTSHALEFAEPGDDEDPPRAAGSAAVVAPAPAPPR